MMDFAQMKLLLANECNTDSLSFSSGFRVSCAPQLRNLCLPVVCVYYFRIGAACVLFCRDNGSPVGCADTSKGSKVDAGIAPQNREEVLERHSGTGEGRSSGV